MTAGIRLTQEEIIYKFKSLHGDRYDYSKVNYQRNISKVVIICREHGEFEQLPNNHLAGKEGCRVCAKKKRSQSRVMNEEWFVEKARAINGELYDYSNVEYKGTKKPVKLYCKKHKLSFFQRAEDHLLGKYACKECKRENSRTNRLKNKNWFIEKARAVHGDVYDYSKIDYQGSQIPVIVGCPYCGKDFNIRPNNHFNGCGCPCQRYVKAAATHISKKDNNDFIRNLIKVHGETYDYSNVVYSGMDYKISIGCKTCGEPFNQTAYNHLNGNGCPNCCKGGFKTNLQGYLYLLIDQYNRHLKIGITNNIDLRFYDFDRESQRLLRGFDYDQLDYYYHVNGALIAMLEKEGHNLFASLNAGFRGFDGATEWFKYDEKIIEWFKEVKEREGRKAA